MAYDVDGTVMVTSDGTQTDPIGPWAERSASDRAKMNDENPSTTINVTTGSNIGGFVGFIFPELREVDGWFGGGSHGAVATPNLQTSVDTTNGLDGTWVSQSTAPTVWDASVLLSAYRTGIVSVAANAVRAVRVYGRNGGAGASFQNVHAGHIYGEISPGETPDRLLWIDETTGLEFDSAKDYGDVPRGSARDIEVRLKNNSASLTATTIQYTAQDLFGGSGAWYTFTTPGGSTFSATQQIASLGAGASTGVIKLRQVVPDAATLGLHAARAHTSVTSWS